MVVRPGTALATLFVCGPLPGFADVLLLASSDLWLAVESLAAAVLILAGIGCRCWSGLGDVRPLSPVALLTGPVLVANTVVPIIMGIRVARRVAVGA
ncbi:hypothetical protein GCM10010172_72590 [Paractinoplanes ferrugineus]|uniref:Uncharacterized protein n=1 Tax=Paractinoplanes ferrugineus TaxID=113564 RepID=A0A919J6N9_9ACTN|nr:hypothetical protein [Actinoplanes ferrugineus]GIE11586.1 hypothetical protein Afe05nite_34260 [Actinoplanes ferrugineus]